LDAARHFFVGKPTGVWEPATLMQGKEVLLLGTGPGVREHKYAIETYIRSSAPVVLAFNTQDSIDEQLIDARIACHPLRLLADCKLHLKFTQPLITPMSMLPENVKSSLSEKEILDFGLSVEPNKFDFANNFCIVPTSLVVAYALAVASSGQASRILLAGFDGYGADDPRNHENNRLFKLYQSTEKSIPVVAVTPTRYELNTMSIYGMRKETDED
jgi:4-hydroxy 2-oxovalerate aldolase